MNATTHRLENLLKDHLHVLLYAYFWFGLFVCGLSAPDQRVAELSSTLVTEGWHLSLLSVVLVLPVPLIYWYRMRRPVGQIEPPSSKVSQSGEP